jgi:Tol biopolymer transport system component/predicted Ser/Thr protein kinase
MALASGTRLGPYEIVSPLGAGGMGDVYRARDTRLDRTVAVKVARENFSERFEREARAIAALNHPHICQLYDVGPNYLVMEYVDGTPLTGPLPPDQALRFAAQICDALDAAHRKGIVHRDLKPANVLVTRSGVKLLDFGIARLAAAADNPTVTSAGEMIGTPAYMAPEQWDGKPADARSDIYAFGCVLYEMLTGKRAALERIPLPSSSLDTVVSACLAKDPDERWQSARDVRRALELPAPPPVDVRGPWRERAGWIAAAVVLVALLYAAFAKPPSAATGQRAQLSVNAPERATFAGAANVTVAVPLFALSPDGRSLVFSAATPGAKSMLWVRSIEDGSTIVLPGTDDGESPFWSPDSRWIAFFAEGRLKRIPARGGPAQVVLEGVPDPRGGSWGPDDTILIGNGGSPIVRVASSGVPAAATKLDESRKEASHRWPVWLPDGRHFLFTARGDSADNSGVYVGSLDGTPRRLAIRSDGSVGYAPPGYVLFLLGDTLFAQRLDAARFDLVGQPITIAERVGNSTNGLGSFSASQTGVLAYASTLSRSGRLTWFDRAGSQIGTVGDEGDYANFELSPDGRRLAFSVVDPKSGNPDIWLRDLIRGSTSRFTFGPRLNSGPIWSPDGGRIVFRTTRRGGQVELYQKSSATGGSETPVLLVEALRAVDSESRNVVASDWSPDARTLLYSMSTTSRTDLWLLPLIDGQKPVEFLRTQADNMHATFSPDAGLVAYSSNESGRFEVYVETVPRSDFKVAVSNAGGYEPRWRADGREVFYLSEDRKLMAVPVEPGRTFGRPKELFQTRIVAERVTAVRTHYSPNRDGTRFLVNTQSGEAPPTSITVVLNWTAGLE